MARQQSLEKLGHYPTSPRVMKMLAELIRIYTPYSSNHGYTLLDPCCGDGTALKALRDALGLTCLRTFGVELNEQLACEARGRLNVVHCGDSFAVDLEDGGNATKVDLIFMNPPYHAISTESGSQRAELTFLEHWLPSLADSGAVFFVIREALLEHHKVRSVIASILKANGIGPSRWFRFPEPEYTNDYGQVVLVAEKKPGRARDYSFDVTPLHLQQQCMFFGIKGRSDVRAIRFYRKLRIQAQSLFAESPERFVDLLGSPDMAGTVTPAQALKEEHAVLVASSSVLDGQLVGDSIVKLTCERREVTERYATPDKEEELTYDTFVHKVALLGRDGHVKSFDSLNSPRQYEDLMIGHARKFMEVAQANNPARFCVQRDLPKYDAQLTAIPGPKVLRGSSGLLPAQKVAAAAVLHGWTLHKCMTLVGEMSVGKTYISLAVAYLKAIRRKAHLQKVVVMTPAKSDLVKKWAREAKAILGPLGARVAVVKSLKQAEDAFAVEGPVVIILPETRAKGSSGWVNCGSALPSNAHDSHVWRRQDGFNGDTKEPFFRERADWVKRDDGSYIERGSGWNRERLSSLPMVHQCPDCGSSLEVRKRAKTKQVCPECGTALWQASSKGKKPRWPIATWINRKHAGSYVLIIDEAHNNKARSARGQASAQLISAAYRTVQMTGTVFGGKASSLFYLLHRTTPSFREVYGVDDVQRFVCDYGLQKRVIRRYRESGEAMVSGWKEYTSAPSEIPGVHPAMINLLLPTTVFLTLSDLKFAMPEYSEHVLYVEPTEPWFSDVNRWLEKVKDDAGTKARNGDRSLLARWNHARFRMLDRPYARESLDSDWSFVPEEQLPLYPKEEAFLRLAKREQGRGRKCLVYVSQINVGDPTRRLIELMAKHGLSGVTMYADVKDRQEFIADAVEEHDVVFTSAALVKEGLDIVECPTIIWYGVEFNTYTVPQANRRPYRLTQTEPVEVYYLAYNRSCQAEATDYIARKLAAAQVLHGEVVSGLARSRGGETMVTHMQEYALEVPHFAGDLDVSELPRL